MRAPSVSGRPSLTDPTSGGPSPELDEAAQAESVEEVGQLRAQPPQAVEHEEETEAGEERRGSEREGAEMTLDEVQRRGPAPEGQAHEEERDAHPERVGHEQRDGSKPGL